MTEFLSLLKDVDSDTRGMVALLIMAWLFLRAKKDNQNENRKP